jgi:hypothetical protein
MARSDSAPGWPRDVRWEYRAEHDERVLCIDLTEGEPVYLRLPRDLMCDVNVRDFDERTISQIWWQAYENTRIEQQLARIREAQAAQAQYQASLYLGLQNVTRDAVLLWNNTNQFARGSDWGFDGSADPEVEARGLALLKENLTPMQRAMYDKHTYFEVIGSHSGKTYRIRHGRQMNIDELGKDGTKVMGWCFLPSGGLCAGDVMLGQKIAIECDERAALKVANKFPPHGLGTVPPANTVSSLLRSLAGLWP